MARFLKIWVISYIGFFLLDMFTHAVLLAPLFSSELAGVVKPVSEANFPVMILQTLIISMGTVYLVIKTGSQNKTQTALTGAVIGLLIYGIHELANYSALVNWSLNITLLHLVAGTIQMAIVALWITFIKEKFSK